MKFKGQVLITPADRHPALATPDLGEKAAAPPGLPTELHTPQLPTPC